MFDLLTQAALTDFAHHDAPPAGADADVRSLSIPDALARLGADPSLGLTDAEAAARLQRHGLNETPDPPRNPWLLFLKKFWGLTAWMLEVTVLLALARHRLLDAGIIAALLLLNGVLGFLQENRASKAVQELKRRLQIQVRVLRQGAWKMVPAAQLVPGDILRLRMGDFVPADAKLLAGNLQLDLSAVTGESEAIAADPGALLLSGAVVRAGEGTGLVALTGAATAFGKTVQLVQLAEPKLHFEAVVAQVVQWLLWSVAGLLLAAGLVWTLEGRHLADMLPLALILMVSAIPVALPAMFTLTLALGSMELTRRGILVTRLSAPEDAARMDVLCSDKTGTLTANHLSLAGLEPAAGLGQDDLLRLGALCSQAANHDPIDVAFLEAAAAKGLPEPGWRQTGFVPFDPRIRRTEATVEGPAGGFKISKGAVESVLELCPDLDEAQREAARAGARRFAENGLRCIAVARQDAGRYRMAGLVALLDRARPEARGVLGELADMGVRVKMLTGDALPIAAAVGRELGMGSAILSFAPHHGQAEAGLSAVVERADGFAEIYPEDKFRIVKALQASGHVVGMTGDGVNDAPALKQAEVGIAVSNATDAAKGAASAVLTTDRLEVLPDLIRVGRSIHQRLETWILNKIVKTFQVVFFVVAAFLVTGRFIVSTFDMVLLLFLVDFVTLALATDRAKGQAGPAAWDVRHLVGVALRLGLVVVAESALALWLGWARYGLGADDARLHSYGFAILFYFGLFTVMALRERGPFWSSRPSGPLLVAWSADLALGAVLLTRGMPGLAPLPPEATLLVAGLALLFGLLVNDRLKLRLFGAGASGR